MTHLWRELAQAVAVVGTLSGISYYGLCLWSARSFLRQSKTGSLQFTPPISILKPLRGTDPNIDESFRSHCLQDYPEYEIIFGVSDANDPAVPAVEELMRDFPNRAIRLLVCSDVLGSNVKVSNLIQMLVAARYEYVFVNDSDMRVPRDYLGRVIAPMSDDAVGMVTCMYRGQAAGTLGSKLEAIGISTEFHAGVLAAWRLEGGVHFGLGSTLAFSRKALTAIGGFEPLVDYLADDYELGYRISQAGYKVVLSDLVVDTHVPPYSLSEFLHHQLRWSRSTRHSRQWGYTGLILTYALPWALLAVLASRLAPWSWALLAVALAARVLVAVVVGFVVLRDRQVPRDLWLLPVRDLFALGIWVASYTGDTVAWRGDQFVLKDGKLTPA
jgi:ceramide glucosyltransferase